MDFLRGRMPPAEQADALVERALFLAATGYSYTEEKREVSDKGAEKVTRTKKMTAPSVSAIAMWLTHRKPEVWGEVRLRDGESDLVTTLRRALEGGEGDGVSVLQSQADDRHHMVEPQGAEEL